MDTCTIAPAGTAERRMNMLSGAKVTKELLNALDNVKKQQTNAQKIRSMTDEELNELFHEIYNAGVDDASSYEWGHRTNSFEWTMEWLQQPVKEMWL